jgi:hypothetical protein
MNALLAGFMYAIVSDLQQFSTFMYLYILLLESSLSPMFQRF